MLLRAALLTVVLSQTIYEWVDSKGESHFTDDPAAIPKSAKRKVSEGAELGAVLVGEGGGDAGKPARAPKPAARPEVAKGADSCATAREHLAKAEKELADLKSSAEKAKADEGAECRELLRTHGQAYYARCMAGRAQPLPSSNARTADLEQEVEFFREQLRRAQVEGCL